MINPFALSIEDDVKLATIFAEALQKPLSLRPKLSGMAGWLSPVSLKTNRL